MKPVVSSAGIIALSTVLLHTLAGSSQQTAAGPTADGALAEFPVERQGPWNAIQQYFHSDPQVDRRAAAPCLSDPANACLRPLLLKLYAFPGNFNFGNVHFVIATVPDPLHTRMAMETDRYLDAIQQAAFDSGYELASQWLPWTVKTAEKISGSGASSRGIDWEKFPGLLVFRPHFKPGLQQAGSMLLVFVVGETPTAGLNGFQFETARQSIRTFDTRQPRTLYIAGPNFSGSFLSLTRLLEESPEMDRVELRAGGVANSEYARAMLVDLKSKAFTIGRTEDGHPSVTFHASALPTALFHQHFMRLAGKFGLARDQIAEIVEDETGFSFSVLDASGDADQGPTTYRYPRDIAQLRNNYNDAAFAAAQPGTRPTSPVDFSLRDTQSGEDTFPTFSTSHTPVSQNAVMQQIAGRLRHSPVRLVSLSATDVFDTLFLANLLARNCPDTRVVLQGADLLFAQKMPGGSLSGAMAISPFPLFPEGAEFSQRIMSPQAPADSITFASSDQIGEFNAVFSLLAPFAINQNKTYRQKYGPASEDSFSSAWLLVLSSRGWMPVDLFGQINPVLEADGQPWHWFDPRESSPKQREALASLLTLEPAWMTLCALLAGFSLAFCVRLFYLKTHPNKHVWSSLCLSDLDAKQGQSALGEVQGSSITDVARRRYFCMISSFASLAALNGLLLCPMLVCLLRNGKPVGAADGATAGIVAAAFASCVLTAVWLAVLCPVQTPRPWWTASLRVAALLTAPGAVFIWWTCCDNGVAGYMLCFRTLTLASPVSPIWPLLLAVSALFALSFFHLRRFTWGDRRQPHLDASIFDELLANEFTLTQKRLEHALISNFGGGRRGALQLLPVAAVFILGLWMILPSGALSSFEPMRFSHLLRGLLLLVAFYTAASVVRFSWSWSIFRAFLVNLNSVLLGPYFMRIPEFGGGSGPVWIREVKVMSLSTAINGSIALHNLALIEETAGDYAARYVTGLHKLFCSNNGQTSRLEFIHAYETFRKTAGDISTELSEKILRPYWRHNRLPFVGAVAAAPGVDSVSGKAEPATPKPVSKETQIRSLAAAVGGKQTFVPGSHTSHMHGTAGIQEIPASSTRDKAPSTEAYEQASKYVALHYSAYIGYVLHQLQNLLLCSVVCFVLSVMALNSFSFEAPQTIFHLASIALVAGGAVILIAFAQIERDPILSRLSGSAEGELGKDFYFRALRYGALPLLTVLSTEFPAIARYVTTWIEPISSALH